MSKTIDANIVTASQQNVVEFRILVDLAFSTALYLHDGVGDISYGGNTYQGVGNFGEISSVSEKLDFSQDKLELTLSGVAGALISTVFTEDMQGKDCTVRLLYFTPSTGAQIEAVTIFKGYIDNSNIVIGKEGAINLIVNNYFSRWDKPNVRRYNDADQKANYPNDKGFEFVENLTQQKLQWGGVNY